jgi:glucose-6-phosphate 1-epimerase
MITHSQRTADIVVLELKNGLASATISVYGGHVLSYVPAGGKDALFVSEKSLFEPGKAIRGGIPVCWPWFGPHPTDASLPLHGFIRTLQWCVSDERDSSDSSEVTLECRSTDATKKLWPHDFRVTLAVSVGARLSLALTTHNEGSAAFDVADAFHAYFCVGDIARVAVHGLANASYDDRLGEPRVRTQEGDVTISGETNRIYRSATTCDIFDQSLGRTIAVGKESFPETVVWNPWIERARAMADFGDDEYRSMLCVEAASVGANAFTVEPGATITQRMTVAVR